MCMMCLMRYIRAGGTIPSVPSTGGICVLQETDDYEDNRPGEGLKKDKEDKSYEQAYRVGQKA